MTPLIETVIPPRVRELGGHEIRRVLPFRERRSVGPFIFLDQFGPMALIDGHSLDVAPHPHIGLSTVTWLFSGAMTHRDSLGSVQVIRPGEVNLMTAGRGIVHSERTSDAGNPTGATLAGAQTWLALPLAHEEMAPAFAHHGAEELPEIEGEGAWIKVILGGMFGRRSPVVALGEPAYAECRLAAGARLAAPAADMEEFAACVVSGALRIEDRDFPPGTLVVFRPGADAILSAQEPTRLLLLGGARLDAPRQLWWNFVSSSRDRIEAAKADWRAGRFDRVPGDDDFIPLPE